MLWCSMGGAKEGRWILITAQSRDKAKGSTAARRHTPEAQVPVASKVQDRTGTLTNDTQTRKPHCHAHGTATVNLFCLSGLVRPGGNAHPDLVTHQAFVATEYLVIHCQLLLDR
jgi:hypothetical protein